MHKAPDQNKRFILKATYQNIHLDGPCQKILLFRYGADYFI